MLVRDIANPSKEDPFFPQHRHKDWYMGHSWASGLAVPGGKPNFLGRNQESTSEAVNAWCAPLCCPGLSSNPNWRSARGAPSLPWPWP